MATTTPSSLYHKSNFCASFAPPFSIKTLVSKQFRVLILLSLPSLYFLLPKAHTFILIILVFFLVLVLTLLVFLNSLPSHLLPVKLKSSPLPTKPSHPVEWSIGSKPKLKNNPNSGCWVQIYTNGDVYEGEFHQGKCSGSGVYIFYLSGRYEGDWIDEKYDGFGVETWAKGGRYRGEYRQGLRHGFGVYRFYTGDVYAGQWSNGQFHGCGVFTCKDGSKYVGEFKWGVKHGLGHYHFRNGDIYAGEYFADKMHGFGVYQFVNRHRYEGAWHEGRRQGLGSYTFRNGENKSGHWQNGFLDIPVAENEIPGSSNAVGLLKVSDAVQEAQQAARKAFELMNVNERVNMAVAAANKAANAARVAAVKAVQNQMHSNKDHLKLPLFDH